MIAGSQAAEARPEDPFFRFVRSVLGVGKDTLTMAAYGGWCVHSQGWAVDRSGHGRLGILAGVKGEKAWVQQAGAQVIFFCTVFGCVCTLESLGFG